MSSAEQSIVSFILNGVELLLKITSFLLDKTSQVLHFPLLQHFVLVVFPVCTCAGKLNLARVKVRSRFGGWRLLFITFIPSDAFFIFGLAFKRGSVSFITLKMSGFLYLYVDTNVRSRSFSSFRSFCWCSCCFGIFLASFMLASISFGGYPCLVSVLFRSSIPFSLLFSSPTMVYILHARLNGVFRFVCDGWHDMKGT